MPKPAFPSTSLRVSGFESISTIVDSNFRARPYVRERVVSVFDMKGVWRCRMVYIPSDRHSSKVRRKVIGIFRAWNPKSLDEEPILGCYSTERRRLTVYEKGQVSPLRDSVECKYADPGDSGRLE